MICGEGKPYLVALAVLNAEMWPQIAAKVGVRHDMPESLTDSNMEAKVLRRIARNISSFPGYAKVHRVVAIAGPVDHRERHAHADAEAQAPHGIKTVCQNR